MATLENDFDFQDEQKNEILSEEQDFDSLSCCLFENASLKRDFGNSWIKSFEKIHDWHDKVSPYVYFKEKIIGKTAKK